MACDLYVLNELARYRDRVYEMSASLDLESTQRIDEGGSDKPEECLLAWLAHRDAQQARPIIVDNANSPVNSPAIPPLQQPFPLMINAEGHPEDRWNPLCVPRINTLVPAWRGT